MIYKLGICFTEIAIDTITSTIKRDRIRLCHAKLKFLTRVKVKIFWYSQAVQNTPKKVSSQTHKSYCSPYKNYSNH